MLQVLGHVEDALDQLGQVGRLAPPLADAAELQQPLVISLQRNASCWIIFRYFGIDVRLVRVAGQVVGQAGLQGLGAEGDARQRVVDLVGDAGGQEADAGQPLGADQLPAAFVDLVGEVAVHLVQPARSCR